MRTGGRPASFTVADVIAAGKRIGLNELTMQRVADALGVTTAAIYRHVPSRSALETLVGEAILGELRLTDDPAQPLVPPPGGLRPPAAPLHPRPSRHRRLHAAPVPARAVRHQAHGAGAARPRRARLRPRRRHGDRLRHRHHRARRQRGRAGAGRRRRV
ncbi:helix-turn-helix domain-containing protein [Nonomuraea salmonea]|uniref:TetR/AcrR family transcriptional regulator n=1 Tax=Nonomuraea salmonea TaxID=46181 RepID=UPI0031ECA9CF